MPVVEPHLRKMSGQKSLARLRSCPEVLSILRPRLVHFDALSLRHRVVFIVVALADRVLFGDADNLLLGDRL
jgi:hypothetical protein